MISLKASWEIDLMKKASRIVAGALEELSGAAKPGITTLELDKIAEEYIRKCGAIPSFKGYAGGSGAPKYPASICASVNEQVVHGIPSSIVLKEGDIVSVDVGAYCQGYHGDAARTLPIGKISDNAQKLIDVTKQSFFEGISKATKGNRIYDISAAIQEYVEANGFSVVRDFVGHGIGREMHEEPQIPNYRSKNRGPRLAPGMTLAIEPMVNAGGYEIKIMNNKWTVVTSDGSLSAHYENTILVTDGEPLILTVL